MIDEFTITILGIKYPHDTPVLELTGQPIPIKSVETDGSDFNKEDDNKR